MNVCIYKAGKLINSKIYDVLKASNKSSILETQQLFKCHNTNGLKYTRKLESDAVELRAISKLDTNSEATQFFGVDSLENLRSLECVINHAKLNEVMEKSHCYSGHCSSIEQFERLFFDMPYQKGYFYTPKEMCTPHFPIGYCGIKMSFTGFKFNGSDAIHSIGFIRDGKGRLFILDSLGNTTPEMQEFHKKIADIILKREKGTPNGIWKVIVNSKVQQGSDELTCNNWTMANLKAVRDVMDSGEFIFSSSGLDRILPDNINKILKEQMELAKTSNYSISL